MIELILHLKNIFLTVSTIIFIVVTLRNPIVGFCILIGLNAFSAVIGAGRSVYAPEITVPIALIIGLIYHKTKTPPDYKCVILFVYAAIITLLTGNSFFNEYKFGHYIFLFGLMIAVRPLFMVCEEKKRFYVYLGIWLTALFYQFYIIFHATDLAIIDEQNRMIRFDTTTVAEAVIDPNYLAMTVGAGVILSILMLIKLKYLYKLFNSSKVMRNVYFVFLLAVALFELLLGLRGLSRGAIISYSGACIAILLYLGRNNILKVLGGILIMGIMSLSILYCFPEYFRSMSIRFEDIQEGGGRLYYWTILVENSINKGWASVIFGNGADSLWWQSGVDADYVSSHNSFLTIFSDFGVIGVTLLISIIIKAVIGNWKRNDFFGLVNFVMLIYVCIWGVTLEPLAEKFGVILFITSLSTSRLSVNAVPGLLEHRRKFQQYEQERL